MFFPKLQTRFTELRCFLSIRCYVLEQYKILNIFFLYIFSTGSVYYSVQCTLLSLQNVPYAEVLQKPQAGHPCQESSDRFSPYDTNIHSPSINQWGNFLYSPQKYTCGTATGKENLVAWTLKLKYLSLILAKVNWNWWFKVQCRNSSRANTLKKLPNFD